MSWTSKLVFKLTVILKWSGGQRGLSNFFPSIERQVYKGRARENRNLHNEDVGCWTSLVVQWLRLHVSTVGGTGSIPGQGTKIPHVEWHGRKKKDVGRFKDPRKPGF